MGQKVYVCDESKTCGEPSQEVNAAKYIHSEKEDPNDTVRHILTNNKVYKLPFVLEYYLLFTAANAEIEFDFNNEHTNSSCI